MMRLEVLLAPAAKVSFPPFRMAHQHSIDQTPLVCRSNIRTAEQRGWQTFSVHSGSQVGRYSICQGAGASRLACPNTFSRCQRRFCG